MKMRNTVANTSLCRERLGQCWRQHYPGWQLHKGRLQVQAHPSLARQAHRSPWCWCWQDLGGFRGIGLQGPSWRSRRLLLCSPLIAPCLIRYWCRAVYIPTNLMHTSLTSEVQTLLQLLSVARGRVPLKFAVLFFFSAPTDLFHIVKIPTVAGAWDCLTGMEKGDIRGPSFQPRILSRVPGHQLHSTSTDMS